MTGDFSRKTFDPDKDFSLVRMQQGRLFTDADWNEQGDILRQSDRDSTADIIGHAGFPDEDPGFGLIFDAATEALLVTPGTGYVAGVRHVVSASEAVSVVRIQGNGLNSVWRIVDGPALANGDVLTADATGLGGFVKVRNFAQAQDGTRTFRTTPALATQNGQLLKPVLANRQPYAPQDALPKTDGFYVAYLKSTELCVTALDDPLLREVAFDGPDTATRDRTIWQVGLALGGDLTGIGYSDADLTCPALAGGFDPVLGPRAPGQLRARAELSDLSAGPCTLPPAAGYRSLENLLFRTQIHNGGDADTATWKWSNENAIHRTRYREKDAGVLIVDSVGRDDLTALKTGDWIEILDQDAIYAEAPGFFARIDEVVGKRVSLDEIRDPVTLAPLVSAGQPDTDKLPPAAFVTRWEGGLPQKVSDAVGGWKTLRSGVQVRFAPGIFQTGDHWTIPARSVTGDIEWPRDPITAEPMLKAPDGPRRDYAALALVEFAAPEWKVLQDCRPFFPPLTKSKQFLYAGGDGQEAMPNPLAPATRIPLPKFLSAAVARGHKALAGESVRFEIVEGDGRLGNGQTVQIVQTDAAGLAHVTWSVDATTLSQRVVATRLDAAGTTTHTAIAYNATLSRADQTSFDPVDTPELAGINNVQDAIEALVDMQQIGCTTYIIREGEDWVSVLENLAPRENASICFARGAYKTSRTVNLSGLGHIRVSGAGPTTASITANRVEAALAFTDCLSVSISNLEIAAPDGSSVIPKADAKGRRGTVDISHVPEVSVHGCLLSCGAGTSPGRTCLSVRGWTEELETLRVTQSVHVRENSFSVGHLQEALLITDARDVDVAHNHFAVKPRKTASLGIDAFLKDRKWVASTAKAFVDRPVKGTATTKGDFKEIRGKEWRMSFESPVSQKSWDTLVAKTPPEEADLETAASFEEYATKIISMAARDPEPIEEFSGQIERLKETFGDDASKLDDPKVREALMVTSEPSVYRFDARKGMARGILLEANGQVVSFDSPFSQADWNSALARSEEAPKVANADELLGLSFALGEQMLVNEEFRRGMGSVANWFRAVTDDSPSLGTQAIVCGGRELGNVAVHDNIIREFQVGIRVAPSHKRKSMQTRSVSIDNNRMELLVPNAEAYGGYGIMVGNARTVRVRGNDMGLSTKPNFTRYFAQGLRVWGDIGSQVLIAENRIAMATMGIRLNDTKGNSERPRLWVLRENLIEGPKGTRAFKISPFGVEIDHHNLTVRL